MKIVIHPKITIEEFKILNEKWNRYDDVELIVDTMSADETARIFSDLLPLISSEFYESVLEILAERPETPVDLLDALFDTNSTACQMAICMRDDLTPELMRKSCCSLDPDVRRHFNLRQKRMRSENEPTRQPNAEAMPKRTHEPTNSDDRI